jgi:GNAT superfamily N-acetyltransferase
VTVRIVPLASAEQAYPIARAGQEHDQPDVPFASLDDYRAGQAHGWPGYTYERYLGLLNDAPVGLIELSMSGEDNLDTVNIELSVLPAARRRGVGRALWELAVRRTREMGRRHLIAPTVQTHPDGTAFATAMGAEPGLEEIRSRLDVRALDRPGLDALLAEAWKHADGYEPVQWSGVPPDEIIDDVAYLDGRLNADAPVGDLAWEPEKVDADRIRAGEENRIKRGRLSYNSGVRRDGRLVAWTAVAGLVAEPSQAWQQITLVDPDHRGRRLGTVVKLENLRYLIAQRPGLQFIDTFNATANQHMLRINRAMGFRAVETIMQWQRTI